jgi:hypothetical protein
MGEYLEKNASSRSYVCVAVVSLSENTVPSSACGTSFCQSFSE